MERQDFNNILITDTKFYIPNTFCGKYVKRKQLTVEDLIGPNYDKIYKYSKTYTRKQLEVLVTMLRHEYLGEKLPDNKIEQLDYYLSFEHREYIYKYNYYKENSYNAFTSWGAIAIYKDSEKNYLHLTDYFSCLSKNINPLFKMFCKEEVFDKNLGVESNVKLIDFFKWDKLKEEKYLYPYAKAYIDAYNLSIEDITNIEKKYISLIEQLEDTKNILIELYKNKGLLPEGNEEDLDIKEMIKKRKGI